MAQFLSPWVVVPGIFYSNWKNQAGVILSNTQNLINVLPGNYYVQVSDNKAPYCGSYTYGYSVGSPLTIATTIQDNDGCSTANGAVSVNVTGGSGNYGYIWKFPNGTESTVRDITGVKAGSYQLIVSDLTLGCTISKNISVKSKNQLVVTLNSIKDNTSCLQPNGGAGISVSGGSGQYLYYWYDLKSFGIVSSGKDLLNVKGGDYSLFVSDQISGCPGNVYVTVPELTTSPQFSIKDIVPNTQCSSPFNGTANLEISGTPGPYEVTWTNGSNIVSTLEDPINLARGVYGFTIKDSQTKCQTIVTTSDPRALTIADESLPKIEVTTDLITHNTLCESSNGTIKVSISRSTGSLYVFLVGA